MDAVHALLWPYLARVADLWPDPPETGEDDGPIPGLVDDTN